MEQFTFIPKNYYFISRLKLMNGEACAITNAGIDAQTLGCSNVQCSVCVMSRHNTNRAALIEQCKERVRKEEQQKEGPKVKEFVSLADSEQFPADVGVSINRDMLCEDREIGFITCWDGRYFHKKDACGILRVCEVPPKKMRPMTLLEKVALIETLELQKQYVRIDNRDAFGLSLSSIDKATEYTITGEEGTKRFEVEVNE
jgi:hypothetical protein